MYKYIVMIFVAEAFSIRVHILICFLG